MMHRNKISLFLPIVLLLKVTTTTNAEITTSSIDENAAFNQKCELNVENPSCMSYPTEPQPKNSTSETEILRNLTLDDKSSSSQDFFSTPRGITPEAAARLRYGKDNVLLGEIEKQQGGKPFGNVLDAGTGLKSLQWIATLGEHGMTKYSAVAGSSNMYEKVQKEAVELGIAPLGKIILGNWFDAQNPLEFPKQHFDTIFVDYLIGSMDAFSPYQQDAILSKLASYLKPGGRMYIVGWEPIPDYVEDDEVTTNSIRGANMICHMRRMRDAAIILAGQKPYLEYPVQWTERQLHAIDDMTVLKTQTFGNLWTMKHFSDQIKNGVNRLKYVQDQLLAQEMGRAFYDLELQFAEELDQEGEIMFGFDYLVSAEKMS